MTDFLFQEFTLSEEIRALLLSVSPATIDRKLRKQKKSVPTERPARHQAGNAPEKPDSHTGLF
jgi:hypothetical protein